MKELTDAELRQEIATERAYLAELEAEQKRRAIHASTEARIMSALCVGIVRRVDLWRKLGMKEITLDQALKRLQERGVVVRVGYGRYALAERKAA
jgi:DNA-binding HxlR family transcriptional regulator